MTPQDFYALGFGFISGMLILMTGVGAGVIVVPGLIALFGMPPSLAIGTASVFSVLTKIMAGVSHLRQGNISRSLFLSFGRFAVPATLLTALLVNGLLAYLPDSRSTIQLSLKLAVVGAAAAALTLMFYQRLNNAMRHSGPYFLPVLSGALVGATGVGGGVLIVPALMAASTNWPRRSSARWPPSSRPMAQASWGSMGAVLKGRPQSWAASRARERASRSSTTRTCTARPAGDR